VCAASEGAENQPTTQADFESRLEHAWLLCDPPSVFGTGEAGLELRPDHRWSKLTRGSGGRYLRMTGWGNEGTWESIDTSAMNGPGHWQLNLNVDGGGTVITQPVFAVVVPKIRLNNEGVYVADYVEIASSQVVG
jgi:hypothetical protein